ncbi:hypothetical protein FGADI_10169 [Fusarium gaditjirri]|uniref:Uncharacterized protein n=1 Tax=Fusarium gaditjirri TaxID=282569 RepID=A0A8H4SY46_9HYPO|nr:hypothetical protein FGADI_10169 [Fusarium gaditjirri]
MSAPPTPPKMDPQVDALVRSINEGTVDIHGIGVDVYTYFPLAHIFPSHIHQLHQAIVDDIFHSAGIQRHEAQGCFHYIVQQIKGSRLFRCSTLEHYGGISFLRRKSSTVMRLQAQTEKIICPPAHVMGCIIAAIVYRKLQPANEGFFRKNEGLVKVKECAFSIELDENCEKPVADLRKLDGKERWVVTTRMPEMNRYEAILRNTLCPNAQSSSTGVPKTEPSDSPLPSVELNKTTNKPIYLSDDNEEMEDNVITLRDYTRQMKILGKRLATPDRAIAKRARREIMKKPEQDAGEVGPPKESFDSYPHFKQV